MALYIVATPIGNLDDMTARAIETLKKADVIAAEDTRQTMKLLARFEIKTKLMSFHKYSDEERTDSIIELLLSGADVALVSDAGTPIISDPGDILVKKAVDAGIEVIPVPGCCAAITALTVSALPAERFVFFGFLPKEKQDYKSAVIEACASKYTAVVYESPHRLKETLMLIAAEAPGRQVALAKELTKIYETVFRGTAAEVAEAACGGEIRGEYVLVIDGAGAESGEVTDDMIEAALAEFSAQGCTNKKAVANTALRFGVSKNRVYGLSIKKDN